MIGLPPDWLRNLFTSTDLTGLTRRATALRSLSLAALTSAAFLAVCALSVWMPNPSTNRGFGSLYATVYLADYLRHHQLIVSSPGWAPDGLSTGLIVLVVGLLVGIRLPRRRHWALIGACLILLACQTWRTLQYQVGFENLSEDTATERALAKLDPLDPTLEAQERVALILLDAQSAYLRGDVTGTARWLNALDARTDFPVSAANWRMAVMRDWVRAHRGFISPNALAPTNLLPTQFKRAIALSSWLAGGVALAVSVTSWVISMTILSRARQIGEMQVSISTLRHGRRAFTSETLPGAPDLALKH